MSELIIIRPSDLAIVKKKNLYSVCHENSIVKTYGGAPISSSNRDFLEFLIRDLEEFPEITLKEDCIQGKFRLCAYMLFAMQKDFIEAHNKFSKEEFAKLLKTEPIFRASGPEKAEQIKSWKAAASWLESLKEKYGTQQTDDYFILEKIQELDETAFKKCLDFIAEEFARLSFPERAALISLSSQHFGNLIYPFLLVRGKCGEAEYASAVLATTEAHAGIFGMNDGKYSAEEFHMEFFRRFKNNARTCIKYLSFFDKNEELFKIISMGEGKNVEFKSTLRWNIRAKKNDEAMTHSCLKTIAAFLNTDGGTLLIGVEDDGKIFGIEHDKFTNNDKFLLHLFNLIKNSMGEANAAHVTAAMYNVNDKTACLVECKRSLDPVFFEFRKNQDEEFYIRTGPGSTRLSPRELVLYIFENFQNR
jgi:schlafen family protein